MPKALHRQLARSARKAGLRPGTDSYNAYVYGTMAHIEKARAKKRKRKTRKRRKR